ncbi:transcriptional adapter 2-alpha-like isoform X2 [Nilaparvata lugens]|nr:transcriptional adapter 2-alpha-like isoform X2 [Nilaparvata lugens]
MENGRSDVWSLKEEVNLLEAIMVCGLDWISISKRCVGRSSDECERHYYNYFIDNPRLIDFSILLKKTREFSCNSRTYLCRSLLSDSVCNCGDNECDNSSLISTIKEENILSDNEVTLKRTFGSVATCVTNRILEEANSDKHGGSSPSSSKTDVISKLHHVDSNFQGSTAKPNENISSLSHNSNLIKVEQDVKIDRDSTFIPKVSEINHDCSNSGSSLDKCLLKNERSIPTEASFSGTTQGKTIKCEPSYVDDVKPCDNMNFPQEVTRSNLSEASVSGTTQEQTIKCEPSYVDDENPCDNINSPLESSPEIVEYHGTRAGFDANRIEFDIEFDNAAEESLNNLHHELLEETPSDDEDDNNLLQQLSISVVQGYMHRLKERHSRKSLVQRFGLLDYSRIANYMKTVQTTFGKRFAKRLVLFKRFFSSKDYDNFMKGCQRLNELKNNFSTLCSYRERGITTLAAGNLYEEMSKIRNESTKQIQAIPVVRRLENGESVLSSTFRRPAPPIPVHQMPGYECLEKEEADFCSIQRIAPKSFLEYKSTLISECQKRKCLKLAHARPLLKIDVNKTRKLYDLLLNKNLIWKDEKMTDQ